MTYGLGESKLGTALSQEVLDESLDVALAAGTKAILFAGEYDWQDGVGTHVNEICAYLQPVPGTPINEARTTWNYCGKHNGLRSH